MAYGDLTNSRGVLEDVMDYLRYVVMGVDMERLSDLMEGIRNGKLADQTAAAACLGRITAGAAACTAGNEAVLRADAEAYDSIVSFPW